MRRRHLLPSLVAALALLAGCSDSNAPTTSHVGIYALTSLNSHALPATVFDNGVYRFDVTTGSLDLAQNNTFVESVTIVEYESGVASPPTAMVCTGSYSRSGNTITLTANTTDLCDGSITATLSGSTLTIRDPFYGEAVFRKQ